MVIYFTGTGNSRYIAKLIADRLSDEAVDASNLIKSSETPTFTSEKPYVFVSPVYSWRMPLVFEEWLKKCRFDGSKKAYFVLTCGGSIGAAEIYTEKLCGAVGLDHMGTTDVVMPDNYIVMFDPPKPEEAEAIIEKAAANIPPLVEKIASEAALERSKLTPLGRLCSGIVNTGFNKYYATSKKFHSTDACVACGKCVDNCMLNNIELVNGRPVWGKECTHCMACISRCPTEAIDYGKRTKGLRRYVCPKE